VAEHRLHLPGAGPASSSSVESRTNKVQALLPHPPQPCLLPGYTPVVCLEHDMQHSPCTSAHQSKAVWLICPLRKLAQRPTTTGPGASRLYISAFEHHPTLHVRSSESLASVPERDSLACQFTSVPTSAFDIQRPSHVSALRPCSYVQQPPTSAKYVTYNCLRGQPCRNAKLSCHCSWFR
jgi:hypothetical protein